MCHCWRITRSDGVKQGFTSHDEDLTFDGTTFIASSGFTATQVNKTLGLAADNLEVKGALSSASINDDDLAAGKYDDAYVELFWVNWSDHANADMRTLVMTGYTGEAKRTGTAFQAELRGLSSRLNQATNRVFQRTCDAVVGDGRCRVNLSLPSYRGMGTVAQALAPRVFKALNLGTYADKWFNQGVLKFTSGPNSNVKLDMKSHSNDGAGNVYLELWSVPAFEIASGWTFEVTAGCDLTSTMCNAKFSNIVNFRGFNSMPGSDTVIKNVDPSASNTGSTTTTRSGGKS
jgi:uncharacterized phage protein (TIGR02218 family)